MEAVTTVRVKTRTSTRVAGLSQRPLHEVRDIFGRRKKWRITSPSPWVLHGAVTQRVAHRSPPPGLFQAFVSAESTTGHRDPLTQQQAPCSISAHPCSMATHTKLATTNSLHHSVAYRHLQDVLRAYPAPGPPRTFCACPVRGPKLLRKTPGLPLTGSSRSSASSRHGQTGCGKASAAPSASADA